MAAAWACASARPRQGKKLPSGARQALDQSRDRETFLPAVLQSAGCSWNGSLPIGPELLSAGARKPPKQVVLSLLLPPLRAVVLVCAYCLNMVGQRGQQVVAILHLLRHLLINHRGPLRLSSPWPGLSRTGEPFSMIGRPPRAVARSFNFSNTNAQRLGPS